MKINVKALGQHIEIVWAAETLSSGVILNAKDAREISRLLVRAADEVEGKSIITPNGKG